MSTANQPQSQQQQNQQVQPPAPNPGDLAARAQTMGFNWTDVQNKLAPLGPLVHQYGPALLDSFETLTRNGFSVGWIMETIDHVTKAYQTTGATADPNALPMLAAAGGGAADPNAMFPGVPGAGGIAVILLPLLQKLLANVDWSQVLAQLIPLIFKAQGQVT